jgi:hypothetical protein
VAGCLLLCILLYQGTADRPIAPFQVDVSIAFGGHQGTGKFTELRIRSLSPNGGTLTLETVGGAPNARLSIELPPGEVTETRLPFGIGSSKQPPLLHASLDDGDPLSVPVTLIRHTEPVAALVGVTASQLLFQIRGTKAVSETSLPHLASAYGQVSALAIDGRSLAALEDAQLVALLEFVGTCGRLMLIDVSAAIERAFVNRASCEGRFLTSVGSDRDTEAAFLELLEQPATTLPSEIQLERLLKEDLDDAINIPRLGSFWIGYIFILVLLIARVRTRLVALGFSVACTLLIFVIWPGSGSRAYVAWAEATSTDRVARFTGLERRLATRSGDVALAADSFGAYPVSISGHQYSLVWNTESDDRQVVWEATPFRHITKLTQGSFAVDSPLQVDIADGVVGICNSGAGASGPAFLQWHGTIFAIPAIGPGSRWSSANQPGLDSSLLKSPEMRLFLDRSFGHTITLLQSLPFSGANEIGRGWLLRYPSDQARGVSC